MQHRSTVVSQSAAFEACTPSRRTQRCTWVTAMPWFKSLSYKHGSLVMLFASFGGWPLRDQIGSGRHQGGLLLGSLAPSVPLQRIFRRYYRLYSFASLRFTSMRTHAHVHSVSEAGMLQAWREQPQHRKCGRAVSPVRSPPLSCLYICITKVSLYYRCDTWRLVALGVSSIGVSRPWLLSRVRREPM